MPYKDKEKQLAYQKEWMRNRRNEFFKDKICVQCGSRENLELDHIDPKTKTAHRIWSWSKSRIEEEIQKCQVLCKECHKKKTMAGYPELPHGTNTKYINHKCRCTKCKTAHAVYKRAYRKKIC